MEMAYFVASRQRTTGRRLSSMYPIDFFYRGAGLDPERIAVEDGSRGLSYGDLAAQVGAIASGLQDRWPQPGARIGVCAYNTIEHMLAVLAIYAAGHTWVALNPRNGKADLGDILERTGLATVVADEDCLDLLGAPEAPVILGRHDTGAGGEETLAGLAEAFAGARPAPHTQPLDAPQTIKFTGGSTGRPKGVLQPYRCVNTSVTSYLHTFGFNGDDVNMCAAPLTHGSSHYLLPILAVGGRHVLVREPRPAALIDAFCEMGCTTAFMPPTMIYNLMADPGLDGADVRHVRHLHYGAAPMPPDQIRAARKRFPGALEVVYGQTEAPMMISAMTASEFEDERNLQSVGRETVMIKVAIMSDDGALLPPGEMGEIVCRGDLLMSGYLDMPEETGKTVVEGWLHTGDAGILDERGYLFIKDRLNDMIISGGFNVYPTEVEAAIVQHPAVREVTVFGVPDEKWGERVEAAVTVSDAEQVDPDALRDFVKERLGSVRAPKRFHLVDELPKSPVGKILRREARRIFADKEE